MPSTLRQIIAFSAVVSVAVVMYFGSYLPWKKSRLFIKAQSSPVRTFEEYNTNLDNALNFYSPIGQEETLLNYLHFIGDAIPEAKDERVVEILVRKAEIHSEPIIKRGPGLNLVQILYSLGVVYKQAGFRLKNRAYLEKAVETLELGRVYSPKRPVFLQELFNLYKELGEKEKLEEISNTIISLWPDQKEEVERLIQEMIKR